MLGILNIVLVLMPGTNKKHLHNIKSNTQLLETYIYMKKLYMYIPIDNKNKADISSLRLKQIGFICGYCDYIEYNDTYHKYKSAIKNNS